MMSNEIRQYDWIHRTREALFNYLGTIPVTDYMKELDLFGGASICSLHAHVADCYRFWLGCFALRRPLIAIRAECVQNVREMRHVFMEINLLVQDFLNEFEGQTDLAISGSPPWQEEKITVTPLWLFTHTITHEFHHKGQIVAMSRQLGYIPTVTDLYHHSRPKSNGLEVKQEFAFADARTKLFPGSLDYNGSAKLVLLYPFGNIIKHTRIDFLGDFIFLLKIFDGSIYRLHKQVV